VGVQLDWVPPKPSGAIATTSGRTNQADFLMFFGELPMFIESGFRFAILADCDYTSKSVF
jgi:hypothetical protein